MDTITNKQTSGNVQFSAGAATKMNSKISSNVLPTAGVATILENVGKNPTSKPVVEEIELTQTEEPVEEMSRKIIGDICPGTSSETFDAKSYELSDSDYKKLVALVYSEAVEHNDYITSDTMGVTSVILNRIESNGFPNNIQDVISAKNQFKGYRNEKYLEAINSNLEVVKPEMIEAIQRVLDGERNTDYCFFNSYNTNSEYNKYTEKPE